MSVQHKHFLNTAENLVIDSLQGLCALNGDVTLDADNKTLYITHPDPSKVALICGGGAGHEPAHAGFVGQGMLTAAVCGNVFASPNASQVRRGIDLVKGERGTVIIVKNYTGDVLNFGLAKEQHASLHPEDKDKVKFVIVGDDVAVGKTKGKIVGRRGLAGTTVVYKIAGALAHNGADLDQVYDIARWTAANLVTVGVSLEHCHVPGTAPSASHLSASEIEIGMGIHNESGTRRVSPVPPLTELIPELIGMLTVSEEDDPERGWVQFASSKEVAGSSKDRVVLMINNLGGVSELELAGIVAETRRAIDKRGGMDIVRVLSGTYMTSLNMPGFSITLLLLPSANAPKNSDIPTPSEDLVLSLLDAPVQTPGWGWSSGTTPPSVSSASNKATSAQAPTSAPTTSQLRAPDSADLITRIKKACTALIDAEPEITRMDNIAGDGDCGLTLKAGAQGVLSKVETGEVSGENVVRSIISVAGVAEEKMGGTSGALYSIFFSALAQGLQSPEVLYQKSEVVTSEIWTGALQIALAKLYTYTRARRPSRTLVDPLDAFVGALGGDQDLASALEAARTAAAETVNLEAKAGRAAYVEGERLKEEQVPDPGAWGVRVILEGLIGGK